MLNTQSIKKVIFTFGFLLLVSCGTYFNQPTDQQRAILGEQTPKTKILKNLPPPKDPVVVGVYNFRDQTGQYKMMQNGSSFSTAISQGGTTILLKALEDSKWFRIIERENLNNLLNERNIIRSTRQEYRKNKNKNQPQLPPLLYAGVLLEGGVISYDSNIVTGGMGARYFGVGGSAQYRQDRITVYLRAISTSSGEILKTVYVSKTILFQSLDASLFRYVNFKRLLEVETGITKKEPVQMAVTEAIEKAVESLIIEGMQSGLWSPKIVTQEVLKLVADYNKEKEEAVDRKIYDRMFKEKRGKNVLEFSTGGTYFQSDYPTPKFEMMPISGGFKRYLSPHFNLGVNYAKYNLANKNVPGYQTTYGFMSLDLKAEFTLLPYDDFTPYFYASVGTNIANYAITVDPKVAYGVGLEYLVSDKLGFKLYGGYDMVFSDKLDGVVAGKRDDNFFRFGVGVNLYLFNKRQRKFKDKKPKEFVPKPKMDSLQLSEKPKRRELRKLRKQNKAYRKQMKKHLKSIK